MTEDQWLTKQIDKYTRDYSFYSTCCNAEVHDLEDESLCPQCHGYCEWMTEAEYQEGIQEDIADQKYQAIKDEQ